MIEMSRKIRRALKKKMGAESSDKLAEKIFQFNKLPDMCSACNEAFDKKDRKMVESWSVVVKQEVVRLFCPHCIQKTKEIVENYDKSNS